MERLRLQQPPHGNALDFTRRASVLGRLGDFSVIICSKGLPLVCTIDGLVLRHRWALVWWRQPSTAALGGLGVIGLILRPLVRFTSAALWIFRASGITDIRWPVRLEPLSPCPVADAVALLANCSTTGHTCPEGGEGVGQPDFLGPYAGGSGCMAKVARSLSTAFG